MESMRCSCLDKQAKWGEECNILAQLPCFLLQQGPKCEIMCSKNSPPTLTSNLSCGISIPTHLFRLCRIVIIREDNLRIIGKVGKIEILYNEPIHSVLVLS